MLLKNVSNQIKTVVSALLISGLSINFAHAQPLTCDQNTTHKNLQKICRGEFNNIRDELNERILTASLVTDAPLRLLDDTHELWLNRLDECKKTSCLKQQVEMRMEDLNFYTSMNQTLTQHYLKFEQGKLSKNPIHLKVHQLTKDRIKVEGTAYRNPNGALSTQTIPLLAYTTPEKKSEILDNEHDCKYQLNFQKALLVVKTQQKGCERFTGIYRLYD